MLAFYRGKKSQLLGARGTQLAQIADFMHEKTEAAWRPIEGLGRLTGLVPWVLTG